MNLVTGATGIIGSHVVLHLLKNNLPVKAGKQKGSDVSKVKRLFEYYSQGALFEKITWVEMDICDIYSIEDALENVTNVFHCAGFVSFSKKDRKKLLTINATGTRNVVDACLFKKIGALCHVSTIGTINDVDHPSPLNETVFWKTSGRESDYALSKYNAEREVWRGMEEGLNAVIVNPGVVLSPGFWDQSSSRIFANCYNGNKFYTGGLTGYVTAPDVAAMMVALIEKRLFSGRFILVENNYYFKEVFDMIHCNFERPLPSIKAPRWLLNLAKMLESIAIIFTGKEPLMSKALINAAFNSQTFSNTRVKETLKMNFTPITEFLGEICQHYVSDRSKVKASV